LDSLTLRVAVLSPFIDRRHGTERCIAEQLERFADQPGAEIHLYSQRVEDLDGVVRYPAPASRSCIFWHKVPSIPGPHLSSYLWWFFANHLQRLRDSRVHGLKFDVVYSAGINAFDAHAISIHIVFQEFFRRVRPSLRFSHASIRTWPVILHRSLYYRLICFLEGLVYKRQTTALAAISQHSADCAAQLFRRADVKVIRYGVDLKIFNPSNRTSRRDAARSSFDIRPSDFCLLLVGNDWQNKGLGVLLGAMSECPELPFKLLVVGSDDRRGYAESIRALGIEPRVKFSLPSPDVMQFYAAADAYVGPSLEDAYGLPVLEAMACGLPVIASSSAGVSEIITNQKDGLILRDPQDHRELGDMLRLLYANPEQSDRMSREAYLTAQRQTWDCNASRTWEFIKETAARKKSVR
jgi:glycosyltransferase involved in cell wall biosynthesis